MERAEWLKWRKDGVGSSDASVLHGFHKWATPLDVYTEKLPETPIVEEPETYVQRKGNELEKVARARLSIALKDEEMNETAEYKPELVAVEGMEFLRSSYDALYLLARGIRRGHEIKYMGERRHNQVVDESLPLTSHDFEDELCRVPFEYWIQIQHQYATGADEMFFTSILNKADPLHSVYVPRDDEFITKHLKIVAEFWRKFLKREPPDLVSADFKLLRAKGAKGLATKWAALKVKEKKIETEMKKLSEEIKKLADADGHPRLRLGKVKLVQIERAGNVQYASIPELKGVDLEKYRGKSTKYWKMDVDRPEKES
jgi:predicted phage-related endonuclease